MKNVTCWSFSGSDDLGPSNDAAPDASPTSCSAKGCYSDAPCATCRLADGDGCEACGADGTVAYEGIVLCGTCSALGSVNDDFDEEPVVPVANEGKVN